MKIYLGYKQHETKNRKQRKQSRSPLNYNDKILVFKSVVVVKTHSVLRLPHHVTPLKYESACETSHHASRAN